MLQYKALESVDMKAVEMHREHNSTEKKITRGLKTQYKLRYITMLTTQVNNHASFWLEPVHNRKIYSLKESRGLLQRTSIQIWLRDSI